MEDYEVEEAKQAAVDALSHYSILAMASIAEGMSPAEMRLRLMKEFSGIPSSPPPEPVTIPPPPRSLSQPFSRELRPMFPAAHVNSGRRLQVGAVPVNAAQRPQAGGGQALNSAARTLGEGPAIGARDGGHEMTSRMDRAEMSWGGGSGGEDLTDRGQAAREGTAIRRREGGASQLLNAEAAADVGAGESSRGSGQAGAVGQWMVEEEERRVFADGLRALQRAGEVARALQRTVEAGQMMRGSGQGDNGAGPSGGSGLGDRR